MTRYADMPESVARHLARLPLPEMEGGAFVLGPPLSERRVAVVSSAGLGRRGDRPFGPGAVDYRVLPTDADANDIVMSHISVNYDRTGFQQDLNIVYPVERLNEMAASGEIGGVAAHHYSFMGASDPAPMQPFAEDVAAAMQAEGVDTALLVPV